MAGAAAVPVTKIAITGAGGFLGGVLREKFEAEGFQVVGIDRAEPNCQGGPDIDPALVANAALVDTVCELSDPAQCTHTIFEGCDVIFHLAADGRPDADFMASILPNNIIATYNILEAARRSGTVRRVVFASSNHAQHGSTMALGGGPGSMDAERLQALGGFGSVCLGDVVGLRSGPDSFYGASKLFGEHLGYLYARGLGGGPERLEFVALRIGWCLYDRADALVGHPCEDYLRAMWTSRRDMQGFAFAAVTASLPRENEGFAVAYALSRNGRRTFNVNESIELLGYNPQDDAEAFF